MSTIEPPGLHADARTWLTAGTEDDARAWVGQEVVRDAPFPVNLPEIGRFCAMVEDPDENHWDEAAATARHGAIISPPGMFMVWGFPLPWRPTGRPERAPMLPLEVPLPGTTLINVATRTTFAAPMRVGDRLQFRERVAAIGPQQATRLGVGHRITTVTDAHRADGTFVGSNENVLFRYDPGDPPADPGDAAPTPSGPGSRGEWLDRVRVGEILPEVALPLTPTRVAALIPAGTRDLFPGHHDRAYARGQGADDIYVNTMFLHGLVDRVGKDWAGPDAWLCERTLRMRAPACVGTTLHTRGHVTTPSGLDRSRAQVAIDVLAGERLAATATLVFDLDGR